MINSAREWMKLQCLFMDTYRNSGVFKNFWPPLCLGKTSSKKKYICPMAMPTKSTDIALPSKTEKPSNTHGRYGAWKTKYHK